MERGFLMGKDRDRGQSWIGQEGGDENSVLDLGGGKIGLGG